MNSKTNKKLIEVSLPLEVINREAAREKSIRHGHPSTMHLYWARRPLAAARAVLFSQLVDDPSAHPELFKTLEDQDIERQRLHKIIEDLVVWENSNNEALLAKARNEIKKYNNNELPPVIDPFAGGGAIPLEAQRLGLEAHASDLNPLSVLLNKSLIEFPPKFKNAQPVSPTAGPNTVSSERAYGLAEDVRQYGTWMRDEAFRRLGHLYPEVTAPGGTKHTVIAWIWARTVKSPNPANPIETPLVSSWWLSKKKGNEAYVRPIVNDGKITFEVVSGADGPGKESDGTKNRSGAKSVADGTPISMDYIKTEGRAGRIGSRLMAIVAEGRGGRLYVSPIPEHEEIALVDKPLDLPIQELAHDPRNLWTPPYGLAKFSDLFTNRQLTLLVTLTDLVGEVRERVLADAIKSGMPSGERLVDGGSGAEAYADAIATYLALAVSRMTDYSSSLCGWNSAGQKLRNVFARQAIPMVWDFAETNPFSTSSGNFRGQVEWVARALEHTPASVPGTVSQADASTRDYGGLAVSTDPPYYDNIGYADLSDFFYVWLRRSIGEVHPGIFSTLVTPKVEELVANPYRHDGKSGAEEFFVEGFNNVFAKIRETANTSIPLTVYYAYKQQESSSDGSSSTGWHTLLDGLISTGWEITATWPMRSELSNRMLSQGSNALASSIVLACRPRPVNAEASTRRAFLAALKEELPIALRNLIQGSIAPVDLAQAAIGPGIAVFSRYSRIREADGSDMSVREALLLINATLDEVLNEQESDFDPDTRFAVKWYRQFGWSEGGSGIADQLARSSDTSIGALERGGVFEAKAGKAKLLAPSSLIGDWDPETDDKISIWECVVRLAGIMAREGADSVAKLLPSVEKRVGLDPVKELGFLLFHEAEKKSDTKDAILFNGLVGAWSDLREQARKQSERPEAGFQMTFDFDEQGDS